MSDGRRRTGWAGGSPRAGAARSGRKRLVVAGAVGVFGFAVFYFFDPELGPRRRRQAFEAVQEAALEVLRLSQQLVDRLADPREAPLPPVPAETQTQSDASESAGAADLANTLHDEVTFFTVEAEPEPAEAPTQPRVLVGVGALAEEPEQRREGGAGDSVTYVQPAAAQPRPTIIAYDTPAEDSAPATDDEATAEGGSSSSARGALAGAAVAAVLLAAAALGAWAIWGEDGGSASPTLAPGAGQAIELISQPGARSVPVAGSKGTMVLVVAPGGQAVLIISGLAAAPAGKEYQAWIVTGGKPASAGLFKGGSTRLVIPLSRRVPKGAIFAVTLESAGGVPAPTQKPQYTAKLA